MITASFTYIRKFKANWLDEEDDVEYIVTPVMYDNIIFVYSNLDYNETDKRFTCDIKIIRSKSSWDELSISLDDEIVYSMLKKDDQIRYNCDLCFSELIQYLIKE